MSGHANSSTKPRRTLRRVALVAGGLTVGALAVGGAANAYTGPGAADDSAAGSDLTADTLCVKIDDAVLDQIADAEDADGEWTEDELAQAVDDGVILKAGAVQMVQCDSPEEDVTAIPDDLDWGSQVDQLSGDGSWAAGQGQDAADDVTGSGTGSETRSSAAPSGGTASAPADAAASAPADSASR